MFPHDTLANWIISKDTRWKGSTGAAYSAPRWFRKPTSYGWLILGMERCRTKNQPWQNAGSWPGVCLHSNFLHFRCLLWALQCCLCRKRNTCNSNWGAWTFNGIQLMLGKCDMICKNHLLLNPLQCQGLLGRDCKQDEKLECLYVMDWMGKFSNGLKMIEFFLLTCGKIWIIKTSIIEIEDDL